MKKYYCFHCDKRVDCHIEEREITLTVKGDAITVTAKRAFCDECGNECYNEELEDILFEAVYKKYRDRHNITTPWGDARTRLG